jgi:hypothetical protein
MVPKILVAPWAAPNVALHRTASSVRWSLALATAAGEFERSPARFGLTDRSQLTSFGVSNRSI